MSTLDKETQQLINRARILGGKGFPIRLGNQEILRLCAIVAFDLGFQDVVCDYAKPDEVPKGYYGTPFEWFSRELPTVVDLPSTFLSLKDKSGDFPTYFKCLAELHKRRMKFSKILSGQPLPEMVQVVPRCLLEYGLKPPEALASWLIWRKWIYDIDNRSAQETGYLFEPILAASIGGIPYSAKKSPIRRVDDNSKGRQVDCIYEEFAYEFKMRVTIAASGQGRFAEELDFARDCEASGYTPVLLVLDPTPSDRLDDLTDKFVEHGGFALVGSAAWEHIEEKAGAVMAGFVREYVKAPISETENSYQELLQVELSYDGRAINLRIGSECFPIARVNEEQ